MLGFMDYIQRAFYDATHWNIDNSYGSLTATAQNLLDFDTPRGLRLNVSSLASPQMGTSYAVGTVGLVDGSISYLYSSLPLSKSSKSTEIQLEEVIQGYRHLQDLRTPDQSWWWERWQGGRRTDRKNTLMYGRMFLPRGTLEALYLRRISPTRQLRLSCVSDSALNNGGTVLGLVQNDHGKYCTEYLYSTDSGLCGIRGLYNFGPDPRIAAQDQESDDMREPVHGRFSAGAELYYGILNKSGGASLGLRFTTLPQHAGFPYTMTLTLNPLMGNLSSTYAVKAGRNLALCSRFNFNFYSYESDFQLGCELWRRQVPNDADIAWAKNKIRPEWIDGSASPTDDVSGVLKARVDQDWRIGLLWEGRFKEMLFTLGGLIDLKRRERIVGAIGVEFQYSS
ncbi:hypothetical protein EJ05DRAFT_459447 [Pseudovirgaria hyperparasitica]|uniref:Mitochondrial distribution and morphology protein 10 n=1 Tax=Pseudovirgaria hyperparasitica TaxID=470096 RepID=A0A6A6WKJ5_9PEZI|nr:uncharacterized protein EJ05DRAFT_459447 [Pseudovirgaria hyperparasitica]KAF2762686.1 hypothetical protein EJ05DRAFT_459447 [Pseudovirgaria hyperparasitica]